MATEDMFTRGTVNEALSQGNARAWVNLRSAGFNPIGAAGPNLPRMPDAYNGGLYGKRVSRLQKGDLLFRFSDSLSVRGDNRFAGQWWLDAECFATIRRASRLENSDFIETARSFLGVLNDWSDMKNLVGGVLTADFWCFKGLTGGFEGVDKMGRHQRMSGPARTDVVQIFVPGGLTLANFTEVRDNILTSGIV